MAKGFMIPAVGAPNSGSGGGGNITVEALTATENKTYTAPEGKAYSPVTVNVSGGSSDFSTAKLTVVNNYSDVVGANGAFVVTEDGDEFISLIFDVGASESSSADVILYKGQETTINFSNTDAAFSVSGGIVDDGDGYFIVSGAGTITITNS